MMNNKYTISTFKYKDVMNIRHEKYHKNICAILFYLNNMITLMNS